MEMAEYPQAAQCAASQESDKMVGGYYGFGDKPG
jgi:hypothetical protein